MITLTEKYLPPVCWNKIGSYKSYRKESISVLCSLGPQMHARQRITCMSPLTSSSEGCSVAQLPDHRECTTVRSTS
jgi:hypothetical protein